MRQTNAALTTKLGWRLLTKKDSLWVRVLRAKYFHNHCDVDMFQVKVDASNV